MAHKHTYKRGILRKKKAKTYLKNRNKVVFEIYDEIGKDKILELYLNEIFLGQNSFGVTAAAQTSVTVTVATSAPSR